MNRPTRLAAWLVFCVACGGSHAALQPLGYTDAVGVTPAVGACERDVDCIVVVGSVCGPCGSCPGEPQRAVPVAALQQERDACHVEPAESGPACPACPAPPADWIDRKAVCVTGSCSLEPPLGFH